MANRKTKAMDEMEQMAQTEFAAIDVDFHKIMSNEELGKWMASVRVAAVILSKNKPELIELVSQLDDRKDFSQDSGVHDLIAQLTEGREKLRGLADTCETALARVFVALSAYGVQHDQNKAAQPLPAFKHVGLG